MFEPKKLNKNIASKPIFVISKSYCYFLLLF